MERIAYCVMVLSLTVNAFRTYTVYLIMQQFQLESRFVESGLIKGLAIILQAFIGLYYYVVW